MTPAELAQVIEAAKQPNMYDIGSLLVQGGVGFSILIILLKLARWGGAMETKVAGNTEALKETASAVREGFDRNDQFHSDLATRHAALEAKVDTICD